MTEMFLIYSSQMWQNQFVLEKILMYISKYCLCTLIFLRAAEKQNAQNSL